MTSETTSWECAWGESLLTLLKELASVEAFTPKASEAHPYPARNAAERGNSDICLSRKA